MSEEPLKKQITFAEEAPRIREFDLADPDEESTKWYSVDEIEGFKTQVKYDDTCIESKIASCPSKSSKAINILLDKKVLRVEDFLGVEDLAFEDGKGEKKLGGIGKNWSKLKIKMMMINGLKKEGGDNDKSKPATSSLTVRRPSVDDCADAIKTDMEFHGITMKLVESIEKKLKMEV